jgi:CNT family concentrative nucleoside transporter
VDWTLKARGVLGLVVLLGLCYALSTNRKAVAWRIVGYGLLLQLSFALLILKTEPGRAFFAGANDVITSLLGFADAGIAFLLGPNLADKSGEGKSLGVIFLFHILPTIIFFAALMSLLYHLGILQLVVKSVAWVMQKTMRTSGAETLSAAANIFVGQTEAPLLVKPFIHDMTRSELMAVMTGGFATVAGGVLAAYVGMLHDVNPNIAGHLLAGSVMAAPTGLVIAKLLVPARPTPSRSTSRRRRRTSSTRPPAARPTACSSC